MKSQVRLKSAHSDSLFPISVYDHHRPNLTECLIDGPYPNQSDPFDFGGCQHKKNGPAQFEL